HDKRHTRTPFEAAVLSTTQRPCRLTVAQPLHGLVVVAAVYHGAAVAPEDYQRMFQQSLFLEGIHQLTDAPVGLHDHISAWAEARGAYEARVRGARHMGLMHGIVQEEGTVFMCADILLGPCEEGVGHVFVYPLRLFTAFYVPTVV